MRLSFSDDDEAFRAELLGWLQRNPFPFDEARADPSQSSADLRPWARRWQRTLFDNGYLVPGWPPELGGRDATAAQQMIYFEEFKRRGIVRSRNPQGLSIITPSLVDYGTDAQREQYVLPTLRAEIAWCLGMSEPNAGSDLASLTTKAVLDGDRFIVNGQKVWTSGAQHADLCFCFVRTDASAPKHKGISVLIIDMKTAGIEHRPISELTDAAYADFNEVFFTDVEVPRANLVGDLHDGWRLSMGSLAHERAMLWIDYAYDLAETLEHLVAMGKDNGFDARQRDAVASVFVDQQALQALGYSGFAKFAKGRAAPEHSILKLFGSEALQRALLTGFEELGIDGLDLDRRGPRLWREGSFAFQYLRSFSATIPGGTSEIQRNIIAERLLGLPR